MEAKIALAGNPNSGKTTLFNELTGARQHVGNYSGVTVEKKEGILCAQWIQYAYCRSAGGKPRKKKGGVHVMVPLWDSRWVTASIVHE